MRSGAGLQQSSAGLGEPDRDKPAAQLRVTSLSEALSFGQTCVLSLSGWFVLQRCQIKPCPSAPWLILCFCHFSGLLTLVAPLDFEVSREYYLSVEGSRGKSSLSDITTVIINVTDVNDNTPVFGQGGYSVEITEDLTPGALVMKVRGGVKVFVFIASHSADGTEKKQRER